MFNFKLNIYGLRVIVALCAIVLFRNKEGQKETENEKTERSNNIKRNTESVEEKKEIERKELWKNCDYIKKRSGERIKQRNWKK